MNTTKNEQFSKNASRPNHFQKYSNGNNQSYKSYDNGYNSKRQYNNNYEQYSNSYNNKSNKTEQFVDLSQITPADLNQERKLFDQEIKTVNFEYNDDVPVEVIGTEVPKSIQSFKEFEFHEIIQNNIKLCQYNKPTPVQKHSMPIVFAKRDLMASAQTGSGKTAAFLMPILNSIYNTKEQIQTYKMVEGRKTVLPIALVLAPTRELALQIYDEAKKLSYRSKLNAFVVYGGADIRAQMRNLDVNGCHLLVATPGRLTDLVNRGILGFEKIKYLVLDEADRMLDMGFEPQIREIIQQYDMPVSSSRQTLMFSATFPRQIQKMAKDFLNDYVFLKVGRSVSTNDNIKQSIVWVSNYDEKYSSLMNILNSNAETLTLIFVETRSSCDELEKYLKSEQYSAVSIHGKKSQSERERALNLFRDGKRLILVATAVAARGLDISNVKVVVNFDLPNDIDEYVHRIGRTGRAGSCGEAISFFNQKNCPMGNHLFNLLKETKQEIPEFLMRMCERRSMKRSYITRFSDDEGQPPYKKQFNQESNQHTYLKN